MCLFSLPEMLRASEWNWEQSDTAESSSESVFREQMLLYSFFLVEADPFLE